MRKYFLLTIGCLLLLGCKQEVLEPEQMIQGKFALDDGSGLTNEYLEFANGHLNIYEAPLFPFAEGKIWHTDGWEFMNTHDDHYTISEGNIYTSSTLSGPIALKDGILTVGGKKYAAMEGFSTSPYSTIVVESEVTFPYTDQDISIPFSIDKPIPAGETGVSTNNSQWITNLKVEDGAITGHLSATSTDRSGLIKLSYTHASDDWVTVKQAPSTFIKASPESLTVEYTASTQTLGYTIENPVSTSTLTATSTASWISDVQVSGTQISFKVSENNTGVNRNGALTLRYVGAPDVTIPVTQKWSASSISLTPSSQTVDYTGGSFNFSYAVSNPRTNATITATSQNDWITDVKQTGSNISYKVAENNSGAQRTGKIKLTYGSYASAEFTVTQKWTASSITMTPSSQTTDYTGGLFNFSYAISNPRSNTSVTASSQASWITNVAVSGNTISYKVAENNLGAQRTGKIKLTYGSYATAEFSVTQTGKPVVSLTLNKSELALLTGSSETLIATVDPMDAPLQWSSDKASVATVDQNGKVTAVGYGTATICVKAGDKTASCIVTVTIPQPDAVDLGLPSGLKWASFNLGASKPEEYGDYYAWGETETKSDYSWSTYKFGTSNSGPFSKYNTKSSYGTVDNKTVLDPEDDVAHVKLGGNWRMPTDAEWTALRTQCTWTWTTQNGVNGRLVTASNGNSIFLPAAGYRYDPYLSSAGWGGYYWSSSLNTGVPYYAFIVTFSLGGVGRSNYDRCNGLSVRPVSE